MELYKTVIISDQAKTDIQNVTDYICGIYGSDMTALRYRDGLTETIQKLSYLADIRKGFNFYVQLMFGNNARHIIYKKMAIIYYVEDDCVYIERVIANSLIH